MTGQFIAKILFSAMISGAKKGIGNQIDAGK